MIFKQWDLQQFRSTVLVIFEMLWHLPIKIPIKHCTILKCFSSTGKKYAVIFLVQRENGVSVRKWQGLSAQLKHDLFLVSVPHKSLFTVSAFSPTRNFSSPYISEECAPFCLAAPYCQTKDFHFPPLLSIRFCQILSSCSNRNSWQGRKRIWTTSGYMAYTQSWLQTPCVKGFLLGSDYGVLCTKISTLSYNNLSSILWVFYSHKCVNVIRQSTNMFFQQLVV